MQEIAATHRMNRPQAVPIVSADAGVDPHSPAALAKKARAQQMQAAADAKYDAPPPPPEGFATEVIMYYQRAEDKRRREITSGLFVSAAILLALYAVAPSSSLPGNA